MHSSIVLDTHTLYCECISSNVHIFFYYLQLLFFPVRLLIFFISRIILIARRQHPAEQLTRLVMLTSLSGAPPLLLLKPVCGGFAIGGWPYML